jgi:hypothetical protein
MTTENETVTVDFEAIPERSPLPYPRAGSNSRLPPLFLDSSATDLAVGLRQAEVFLDRLRSLDAIHVLTALDLRPIEAFVSYDKRQLEAAGEAGLPIASPGMKK